MRASRIVALLILGISPLAARADELDRIIERDQVLAQKLQSQVEQAITNARIAEATDPTQAIDILQKSLTQVRSDQVLSEAQRSALVQRLQARLTQANEALRAR